MRAKTLNLNSSVYKTQRFATLKTVDGVLRAVNCSAIIRLQHDDAAGFSLAEAYMSVSENIPTGSIAENYKIFAEVIDEWYNAEIDASNSFSIFDDVEESARIRVHGFVSLIDNYKYRAEFEALSKLVSEMKTKRELKVRK